MLQAGMAGERIVIAVRDSGCGIAPEDQQAVFDKFGGVGGRVQRDKGGSGLGLSLVRRLLQLMQGEVSLESEPGKGSVFTVVLPALRCAPAEIPDDAASLYHSTSGSDSSPVRR